MSSANDVKSVNFLTASDGGDADWAAFCALMGDDGDSDFVELGSDAGQVILNGDTVYSSVPNK